MPVLSLQVNSPLGPLTLIEKNDAIVALDWGPTKSFLGTPLLQAAAQQLHQYFAGERKVFDLPIAPVCTTLQQDVFAAMCDIPFGETRTYGDLAKALDCPAQTIGQVCGENAVPILIPCHRVVGADGALTGYSWGKGVETKRFLLQLEGALPPELDLTFPDGSRPGTADAQS